MGMEALLASPSALAAGVKLYGLKAARLDIHPESRELVLSYSRKGKIYQVRVPIGVTFTADEICTLLVGGQLPDPPRTGPNLPSTAAQICAIAAESPP